MNIDKQTAEAAILGGTILGGGGGGWIEEGKALAYLALENGFSEIFSIRDIPDEDLLLTVSGVGAPSAGAALLKPVDYIRAVELFLEQTGINIGGLISSEIGALGIVNGWLQSAALNIPVVDAPCNGRAHPLGLMGSMGLTKKEDYISLQTAVGGRAETGNRVEAFFKGSLPEVSKKVREAAVKAGGMVAVARNPVSASYVKVNGAPGAIRMALEIGKLLLKNMRKMTDPEKTTKEIVFSLGGRFTAKGIVKKLELRTEDGFDIGKILLRERKKSFALTFWNEYMTLEREGERIATFPDLIMTFDAQTSMPFISAQVKENREVIMMAASAQKLILGAGMRDDRLLRIIEDTIGQDILSFRV
jgi:DUF917 family protein